MEEYQPQRLFELTDHNRNHLRDWRPWVDKTQTIDDTRSFIERVRNEYAAGKTVPTTIWYRERVVGTLGLQFIKQRTSCADIGYWLVASFEGKGIMTRACRALVNYAFSTLELHRLVIRCDPNNHRSRAIAHRLEFRHEGTLRECALQNGEFIDHDVFSMLRHEWDS